MGASRKFIDSGLPNAAGADAGAIINAWVAGSVEAGPVAVGSVVAGSVVAGALAVAGWVAGCVGATRPSGANASGRAGADAGNEVGAIDSCPLAWGIAQIRAMSITPPRIARHRPIGLLPTRFNMVDCP
jgi:hypothetical protein